MADPFASFGPAPALPARQAAAVVPADGADLPTAAKALYVGVAGDVVAELAGNPGTAVTFKAHPVGYLMARVSRVHATGTTATNLLALYD